MESRSIQFLADDLHDTGKDSRVLALARFVLANGASALPSLTPLLYIDVVLSMLYIYYYSSIMISKYV